MPHSNDHFDFETLLAHLPASQNELLSAIDILEDRNERELALQMLELAVKQNPNGPLRKALAERYLFRKNMIRAQEIMVEQILDETDDGEGLMLLARAYSGLGQLERARESLQRAHESGIAQDRILFWAEKLKIPAERKPPQAQPASFNTGFVNDFENDFHNEYDNAGAEDPTYVSYFKLPDSQLDDPRNLTHPPPGISIESADSNDETGIHFGLFPGEELFNDIASPTDETGIHFGLFPGEDDTDATAGPTDETGIHFGLFQDDAKDITNKNNLRQSGAQAAIRQSQSLSAPPSTSTPPPADLRISSAHDVVDFSDIAVELEEPKPNHQHTALRSSQALPPAVRPTPTPNSQSNIDPAPEIPASFNKPTPKPALELDRDPASTPTSSSKPRPTRRGTNVLRNVSNIRLGKPRFGTIRLALIVIVALAVLFGGSIAFISKNEIQRLDQHVIQANAAASTDTYENYLKAHAILQQAAQPPVYAAGLISNNLFTKLTLPGLDPDEARPTIYANLALISALLEYRFESAGTRNAAATLDNINAPHADKTAAQIYLALTTRQHRQTKTIIDSTSKNYTLNASLRAAVGHALLDATPPTPEPTLQAFVDTLTALPNPTIHDHFLLAMINLKLNKKNAAIKQFEELETSNPHHTSTQLQLAKLYLAKDTARARSILHSITDAPKDQLISPYEKARAHIELGLSFSDDTGKAEDHFKQAIALMPRRTPIYEPLLDLYLKDFRFDKARTLLSQAQAANETSEYIAKMRAELFLNAGMATQSLQILDARMTPDAPHLDSTNHFHWLRGLSYLMLEEPNKAMEAFQLAAKDKSSSISTNATTAAAAFALYAGALTDPANISAAETAIIKLSENVTEENPPAADIHRAAGLIQLLQANHTSSRARATTIARNAQKSFQHALQLRENDSIILYDICQTDIFLQTRPNKSCETALAINAQFLPGMLAIAQLHILNNDLQKARDVLLELRTRHPLHPPIALMLARVFIEQNEIDKASTELNSLLGKPAQKSLEYDILEGRSALSKSEYTRALGYFERAHKSSKKSDEQADEISLYLSQTLTKLGHTERAAQLMPSTSPKDGQRRR